MNKQEMIEHIKTNFTSWNELVGHIRNNYDLFNYKPVGNTLINFENGDFINKHDVFPFKPVMSTTLPEGVTSFVAIDKWGAAENVYYNDGAYEYWDKLCGKYIKYGLSDVVFYVYEV